MTISKIRELLDATLLCGDDSLCEREVSTACGSDMMSDVLAYVKDQAVLLSGLVNTQVVRTAAMMDMICIVFVRDKQPSEEILSLAREHDIVVMRTSKRMYDACGILYSAGLHTNGDCHG